MKRILSLTVAMLMLLQFNVFAKTVNKQITYTRNFKTVETGYKSADDGWSSNVTVNSNGMLVKNTTAYYEGLGANYQMTGVFSGGSWNAGQETYIYIGKNLRLAIGGANPGNKVRLQLGSTLLKELTVVGYLAPAEYGYDITVVNNDEITVGLNKDGSTMKYATIDSLSALMAEKGVTEDPGLGAIGFSANLDAYLRNISLTYYADVEIYQLGIMPQFQSFGANTTAGLRLNFTAPVDKTALTNALIPTGFTIDNVTMENNDTSAVLTITPTETDCTLTVDGLLVGKDGEWMGTVEGDATPFVYNFKVNNETATANEIKDTNVTVSPNAEEIKLYDTKRFDNEIYYTGDVALASTGYAYFGTKKTDDGADGYRLAITAGDNSKVEIQKYTDGVAETVATATDMINKFKVGGTAKFGIEVNSNGTAVKAFVIGENAYASVSYDALTLPGGYVGAGCDSKKSTFSNAFVYAKTVDEYAALQIVDKSVEFDNYSVYKTTDTVDFKFKINTTPANLIGTPVYKVDGIDAGELTIVENESDASSTVYSASISGLSAGSHTVTVEFTDKFGDVQPFTSNTILVSDKKAVPVGFYDGGVPATDLSAMAGKALTVKFDVDYASGYKMFVVLRNNTTGKQEIKIYPFSVSGAQTATYTVPANVTDCTLKAFMCSTLDSTPISGYIELK